MININTEQNILFVDKRRYDNSFIYRSLNIYTCEYC